MSSLVILLAPLFCVIDGMSVLQSLEKQWNEAHLKGDADVLDKLWANELIVTVQEMPVMNKEQSMAIIKNKIVKFTKYETSEVKSSIYGETAVVTGKLNRVRVKGGKDMEDNWRFTKVYIKRDGHWQVVAWHGSQAAK